MGEESGSEEPGGVGPAVSVVDADERGGRGGQHLRLVLHGQVGLRRCHRELPRRVRPQLRLPQHPVRRRGARWPVAAAPRHRPQHLSSAAVKQNSDLSSLSVHTYQRGRRLSLLVLGFPRSVCVLEWTGWNQEWGIVWRWG